MRSRRDSRRFIRFLRIRRLGKAKCGTIWPFRAFIMTFQFLELIFCLLGMLETSISSVYKIYICAPISRNMEWRRISELSSPISLQKWTTWLDYLSSVAPKYPLYRIRRTGESPITLLIRKVSSLSVFSKAILCFLLKQVWFLQNFLMNSRNWPWSSWKILAWRWDSFAIWEILENAFLMHLFSLRYDEFICSTLKMAWMITEL